MGRGRVRAANSAIALIAVAVGMAGGASAYADGGLDLQYGSAGYAFGSSADLEPEGFRANDSVLGADGKMVVAGRLGGFEDADVAVARFQPNGALDTTFSGDGWFVHDFGAQYDEAFGVAVQPDGKVLIAGFMEAGAPDGNDFLVARLTTAGELDTTFSNGGTGGPGWLELDFSNGSDIGRSILSLPDGSVMAGGGTSGDPLLAKLDSAGAPDDGFGGGDGFAGPDFEEGGEKIEDLAIQSDGKVVGAGSAFIFSDRPAVYRFDGVTGQPDTTFGPEGTGVAYPGKTEPFYNIPGIARSVAIQPDGAIVVAGGKDDALNDSNFLARLLPSGGADPSFGGNGGDGDDGWLYDSRPTMFADVALQRGRIIVVGEGIPDVLAFTSAGALDGSFGSGGAVTLEFPPVVPYASLTGVAATADHVVVAGNSGTVGDAIAARLLTPPPAAQPPPAPPAPIRAAKKKCKKVKRKKKRPAKFAAKKCKKKKKKKKPVR
jgi:uncharacterized delta-60 repeat protein